VNCAEARTLLDAYVDDELDLARSLEIERHLEGCPACTRAVENRRVLGAAIRSGSLVYEPRPALRANVETAVRRVARSSDAVPITHRWPMIAIAAGVVLAIFFIARIFSPGLPAGATDLVAQEVLDSHLRSLMPGHLSDVQSTDRHTVKPWFNGKLDFSPPVSDFAAQGFPLTVGRLDSLAGRTVAVLIYQRGQHVINVYIWPAPALPDTRNTPSSRQGYNMIHWTHASLNWWLASDLNPAELEQFSRLLRNQAAP